ncbi:MAG: 3(2), 5-bisphosphate nucleotidase [Acidimicrobiaceae bacterium]|jgi:3'(2'), 5'-bisphosphate nucleotidase
MPSGPSDHDVATDVATRAGELLLKLRASVGSTAHDWWSLRDEGDWSAHRFIVEALHELRPDDKVLSEEGIEDRTRLGADRVWIVDPLDGTREFGEPGRSDWAVHVALVDGKGEPIAGAVALPAIGITLSTDPAPPPPPAHDGAPRIIVSRTRPPAVAIRVAEALGGDLIAMGSAGAKAMAVVLGEADIYAHAGGQYEWDNCAPAAVALATGLHASRINGRPLVYNRPDPWLPDLLICRPEFAEAAINAIGA